MTATPQHRTRVLALLVSVILLVTMAACGDDSGDDETATTPTTTETTTETDDGTAGDDASVATALCEAYGGIEGPEDVDALLDMMSDDVQVTDTVMGATLTGKDEVRAYLESDLFAGIDQSECGATVQANGWVAGAYTLTNSATGEGGEGIAAIHVTDGRVDRQVNHYTSVTDAATPPTDTVADSVVEDYCQAWADGPDPAEVTGLMTPDAELVVVEPIVGTQAIAEYVEQDFPFDQTVCGEEAVEFGEWVALTATFSNSTTGLTAGGVNIVAVDDQGLVRSHFVYAEPPR